jgi:vitellogenic carboxypeptidase-like protein
MFLLLLISTLLLTHASASPSTPNDALDLTQFVHTGDYKAAQAAAQVRLPHDPLNLTSYSGFLETTPGRHMFMWYFPAQNGDKEAPLLIWLQGGPGGSSMFGLFSEMGPYSLGGKDGVTLLNRPDSWNKKYGMLFIDNPVGAGFSYPDEKTGGAKGFCTNTKECISTNLYNLMESFYVMFPDQLQVPLFITGESYGGHYVPGFASKIYQNNVLNGQCFTNDDCPKSYCNLAHPGEPGMCHGKTVPTGKVLIPLRGVAIGDGWIDPINMVGGYPEMMFNFGLCDLKQKVVIQDYCDRTVAFIAAGNMTAAFAVWDEMLNGDVYPYPNYFHNITGSNDYDNFLRTDAPEEFGYYSKYVSLPAIKQAMHTGSVPFGVLAHDCEMNLLADFHVSLATELVGLLETNYYRIFIYSGQLDVIIGAPLTERFLNVLQWSGLEEYKEADRTIWMDETQTDPVSGYVREAKTMTQIIIRGAGHIAPHDQPVRALDMINHMVHGTAFGPATKQEEVEL